MVSPSERRVRDARKIVDLIAARTYNQNVRSPEQTAFSPTHEAHHHSISNNVRGSNGYTAGTVRSEYPSSHRRRESRRLNFRSAQCNPTLPTDRLRLYQAAGGPRRTRALEKLFYIF